jgi:hypothetical protein
MYIYKKIYISKKLKFTYSRNLKCIARNISRKSIYLIICTDEGRIEIVHNIFYIRQYDPDTKVLGIAESKAAAIELIKDIVTDMYVHKKDVIDDGSYKRSM